MLHFSRELNLLIRLRHTHHLSVGSIWVKRIENISQDQVTHISVHEIRTDRRSVDRIYVRENTVVRHHFIKSLHGGAIKARSVSQLVHYRDRLKKFKALYGRYDGIFRTFRGTYIFFNGRYDEFRRTFIA